MVSEYKMRRLYFEQKHFYLENLLGRCPLGIVLHTVQKMTQYVL